MKADVEVQYAIEQSSLPTESLIETWVNSVLAKYTTQFSLCVRIVDCEESQSLNSEYRGKESPTNVLSFPFEMPECVDAESEILGDLIICAQVVANEAEQQGKKLFDHWAHMIVHGTLHLLGFDHINEEDAEEMEQLERDILATLDIADPYTEL